MNPRTQALIRADQRNVWHPFTAHDEWLGQSMRIIDSAEGNYLIDTEGRRYLDGVSSLWTNVHGHRQPDIDAARSRTETVSRYRQANGP